MRRIKVKLSRTPNNFLFGVSWFRVADARGVRNLYVNFVFAFWNLLFWRQ